MSPLLSPPCLPTIVQHMELTSSPENLLANEAVELDRQIMAQDGQDINQAGKRTNTSSPALDDIQYFDHIDSLRDRISSPSRAKDRGRYKVEVPLLPLSSLDCSPLSVKTLSFPADLLPLVPPAEDDIHKSPEEEKLEDVDIFMRDVVVPLAEPAIAQVEDEGLVELDTTMRVLVPDVHTQALAPPWTTFAHSDTLTSALDAQRTMLRLLRRDLMKDVHEWGGISKLDKVLPWCAFPVRLGNVALEEALDDGFAYGHMDDLNTDASLDVKSLIPTMDRIRLLEEETIDDDELDYAEFNGDDDALPEHDLRPDEPDTQRHTKPDQPQVSQYFRDARREALDPSSYHGQSLLKPTTASAPTTVTRPIEPTLELPAVLSATSIPSAQMVEDTCVHNHTANPPAKPSMRTLLAKRKRQLEAFQPNKASVVDPTRQWPHTSLQGSIRLLDNLSNGSGLANFLHVQGGQAELLADEIRQDVATVSCSDLNARPNVRKSAPAKLAHNPLPVPKVFDSARAGQIILSPHMFADRALIRGLQSLLPNVEPIERTSLTMSDCKKNAVRQTASAVDADITLSPSTGVTLTTLQRIKQRPLPGQTSFHGIREQVSSVAGRYEMLIVLVHDPRAVPSLDDHDTEALNDFIGFALSLAARTQVFYVLDSLEQWLAAIIVPHIIAPTPATRLLPDETTWERFLREAGMNAFAAQVVLNLLKNADVPDAAGDDPGPLSGLPAFLRMSRAARVQRFSGLLGGERVLAQVSAVVDGSWTGGSESWPSLNTYHCNN
nr:hypothetical protein CFP56_72378 [Quercus suber]